MVTAVNIEELCSRVHQAIRCRPLYEFPAADKGVPKNGIYFLFEKGETGHAGRRIVRVGSHTGQRNLAHRLVEHTTANKDRSIFRKNIGRALLNRDKDPFLKQWNWDLTKRDDRERFAPLLDKARQNAVEESVTAWIVDRLSYTCISVDDQEERLALEKALIATVAQCEACTSSAGWLGRHSPVESIGLSGLWLKQHLRGILLSDQQIIRLETICGRS